MIEAHKERIYLCEMDDDINGGFNKAQALVKRSCRRRSGAAPDLTTKNHYLECYFYMVYFLNENVLPSVIRAWARAQQKTRERGRPDR